MAPRPSSGAVVPARLEPCRLLTGAFETCVARFLWLEYIHLGLYKSDVRVLLKHSRAVHCLVYYESFYSFNRYLCPSYVEVFSFFGFSSRATERRSYPKAAQKCVFLGDG